MSRVLAVMLLQLFLVSADAAPMPINIGPGKISPTLSSGAVTGGRAASEFSLIGVRANVKNGREILELAYGDAYGRPIVGEPGYFHVTIDRGGKRVSIDLAQVQSTAVDPMQLKRILVSSKLIASSDMVMDPHDRSTNITLLFKEAVTMKVAAHSKKAGSLRIELSKASPRSISRSAP